MEKNTQLKTIICGIALAALVSVRPGLAQEGESHCPPCEVECEGLPPCEEVTFSPEEPTQEFNFGTGHKIKITANVLQPFSLAIQFFVIDQDGLDARLNPALADANCIPYDGATFNGDPAGQCGFYHVVEPLPIKEVDYTGDVLYKVFWDFPTLDLPLNNVRLYRAPIPEEDDQDCPDGFNCYTQDITGIVYPNGDSGTGDPGAGGKSKGFSDYEVVDRVGNDLTAKVKIGLKWIWDTGIRFDLKAVVKRNGEEVSSGELLGVPGGGRGFENANLLTIPVSFPTEAFEPGDDISLRVLVRNSCLGSPQLTGVARLWYDDNSMSQVTEAEVPTLYLVRGNDHDDENCDHDRRDRGDLSPSPGARKKKRDVRVWRAVPSCDGPYRSFGKWNGTVPY